jgi:peptidoglycan hydrolase-like protein with peptidoglycan-binding domain
MANPPIAADYGSVDENPPPDFAQLRASGVKIIIVRGCYGRPVPNTPSWANKTPFLDPNWDRDKHAIKDAKLKRASYLYLCMPQGNVSNQPEPEEQAEAFVDYVKPDKLYDYVPFFDVEQQSSLRSDKYYEWVLRCATKLHELLGAWPGLYSAAHIWAEYLNHHSPGELLNCPLWLAKPWPIAQKSTVHLDGMPMYSPTLIPEWGTQWFGYQYQGDAIHWPGIHQADASRWRVFGQGARGQHVSWLQKRLKQIDGRVIVDGNFGPITKDALQKLQLMKGIAADGIFGADSYQPISWMDA